MYKRQEKLEELDESNFAPRLYQRPPGYAAHTRVHAGRLCIPMLNDTGATCACLTEEQVVLIVNHTQKMLDDKLMTLDDYNYPIVQIFKYTNAASMTGAPVQGRMLVEYAVTLRIEFIPEGSAEGPVKEIYFKIFKKGTCGVVRGVLGWPNLDQPVHPRGEGLGWTYTADHFEYRTLGVKLPRLDDRRKINYNGALSRYIASKGQLMYIDDVTQEKVRLIDSE